MADARPSSRALLEGPITVVVNTGAGGGAGEAVATQIRDAFAVVTATPRIVAATGAHLATATRQAIDDGSTVIVAAGGDGTVNAVAGAILGSDASLAVLPLGTLNHFAKDLGMPTGLAEAVRAIGNGLITSVDVGEVNGHFFVNNSSVGLYPRLVWERLEEQRRGRRKWQAMLVAIARVWRRYRRVEVTVADHARQRTVHTPFVFVGNNEYLVEGARIGRRQRLDEGRLHVCMAPGLQRADVARVLLAALVGRLDGIERFESVLTASLSIAARRHRLGVTVDGELLVLKTPLAYRIHERALRVIVPREGASEQPFTASASESPAASTR